MILLLLQIQWALALSKTDELNLQKEVQQTAFAIMKNKMIYGEYKAPEF